MSDEKIDPNEERDPELLPERDVMSLIDPATGLLAGGLPTASPSATPIDPVAGAGGAGAADPTSLAHHVADGQASQSGPATVSDQPQTIPVESTNTASSST